MKFSSATIFLAFCLATVEGKRVRERQARETSSKAPGTKAPKSTKAPKAPITTTTSTAAATTTTGTTTTTTTSTTGSWARRLQGFDETLYEGYDQEKAALHRRLREERHALHALCTVKASKYWMEYVTYEECVDPANRNDPDDADYEPWIVPTIKHKVLAKNPGIFELENFLSEQEVEEFVHIIKKNGNNGLFGPCADYVKNPFASQVPDNKLCFKMSKETMCEGPYQFSSCSYTTSPEDAAFIERLHERIRSSLSVELEMSPFFKFHVAQGDTPPFDLHEDINNVITVNFYLTDGGATTVFPYAGVEVVPRKGTAVVWLNVREDGTSNHNAFHAVKYQPAEEGERISAVASVERKYIDHLEAYAMAGEQFSVE